MITNVFASGINLFKIVMMDIKIINEPLQLQLHGFSGIAINKDYAGTAFKLMDKMWQVVKSKNLQNKGLNIWVYEPDQRIFAGVELNDISNPDTGLEEKNMILLKYAYYKHIGAYNMIQQAGQRMTAELKNSGYETTLPYIEIYGHWTNDETKLETELLMCLK
jgi:predicted transcriptional regulator YdeE